MASALPITTTGSGTQNTTQDPQTAGTSTGSGAPTSSVQPGSVSSLDTAVGGVPLSGSKLSTVALSPTTATVVKADVIPHHTSVATVGLAAIFFILALGLLIAVFVPAKNTTD